MNDDGGGDAGGRQRRRRRRKYADGDKVNDDTDNDKDLI